MRGRGKKRVRKREEKKQRKRERGHPAIKTAWRWPSADIFNQARQHANASERDEKKSERERERERKREKQIRSVRDREKKEKKRERETKRKREREREGTRPSRQHGGGPRAAPPALAATEEAHQARCRRRYPAQGYRADKKHPPPRTLR